MTLTLKQSHFEVNVDSYLKRIDYDGPREPTADVLRALQLAHLTTVPFENLSIHCGEPIVLDDDALFTKIVEKRRGGFCYEANGLFAALLRALGFDVTMLAAEVANAAGEFGPPFDHMTLLVTIDAERWLVDVGFGDSSLHPLRLDERGEQRERLRSYRIRSEEPYLILDQREGDGEWISQYRFTLTPHVFADYDEMCRYHQTSPESHFTQAPICSRVTENGRVSLSQMRLITTSDGKREERTLANEEEYARVLRDQFGIVMSA